MSTSVVTVKMIENSVSIAKNGGGSYVGTRITYDEGGQIRVKGLHPVALSKNPTLLSNLEALSSGGLPKTVVLTTEKVDGFVNFISLVPTDGDVDMTSTSTTDTGTAQATTSTTTPTRTFAPRNNVGTGGHSSNGRDEAISKAVALKAAVEFGSATGVTDVDAVIAMSEKFNTYLSGKTGE